MLVAELALLEVIVGLFQLLVNLHFFQRLLANEPLLLHLFNFKLQVLPGPFEIFNMKLLLLVFISLLHSFTL